MVVTVRTDRAQRGPYKNDLGQYSPVRLDQARLLGSLLYGIFFLGYKTPLFIQINFRRDVPRVDDESKTEKSGTIYNEF